MSLCQFKHIFGEEGKGVHSLRFMGVAIIDVVGTFAVAIAIARYCNFDMWTCIAVAFATGVFAHWMFCVNTTVNVAIFGQF